jgi:hypothetical protein
LHGHGHAGQIDARGQGKFQPKGRVSGSNEKKRKHILKSWGQPYNHGSGVTLDKHYFVNPNGLTINMAIKMAILIFVLYQSLRPN